MQPRTQQRENSAVKQEINSANSQPVLQVPTTIYRESSTQETLRELINLQAKQAEISLLLVEQQKRNGLPAEEPPVFSGNAFDYPAFTTAFDSIISGNVQSNRDRLYFLDKYIVGKANEIVKGFLAVNSEDAYTEDENFWTSDLATQFTWLRPTSHAYVIGHRLKTEIAPDYKPFLISFSVAKRL